MSRILLLWSTVLTITASSSLRLWLRRPCFCSRSRCWWWCFRRFLQVGAGTGTRRHGRGRRNWQITCRWRGCCRWRDCCWCCRCSHRACWIHRNRRLRIMNMQILNITTTKQKVRVYSSLGWHIGNFWISLLTAFSTI